MINDKSSVADMIFAADVDLLIQNLEMRFDDLTGDLQGTQNSL